MSVSDDQIAECFNAFDKNGAGVLEGPLIGQAIRALGKCPNEKELKAIIEEGGKFDLQRLKQVVRNAKVRGPIDLQDHVRDAFRALDKDSRGSVPESELRLILSSLGDALTTQEVNALLANFQSPDGNLDYGEFVKQLINGYPANEMKGRD